jgi:cyclic di-GMP phosphodiesterase
MDTPLLMVIDDEMGVRESLKIVFVKDFRVLEADSIDTALPQVQAEKPQVVLLDVLLPKANGIEILRQIKAIHADCEVILLTALNTRQLAARAMDSGAFDLIGKPFDVAELRDKVYKALAQTLQRAQTPQQPSES